MKCLSLLLLVTFSLGAGCGCGKKNDEHRDPASTKAHRAGQLAFEGQPVGGQRAKEPAAVKEEALSRKIKYTSEMKLVVEDFFKSEEKLKQVIKAHKGSYVAQSEVRGSPGSIRQGHWRVRVPVELFEPFREAVLKIGEVEKNTTDSEDVTEEYYDLENTSRTSWPRKKGYASCWNNRRTRWRTFCPSAANSIRCATRFSASKAG